MPLRCRRDGRIRLVRAVSILHLTEIDEPNVTVIDDIYLADLVAERELQRILFLELVLPGCVFSPCPFSSELLVLDGCTCAAAMILFLLLLVRFPDRRDVIDGRAVIRELHASQCLRMRLSVF